MGRLLRLDQINIDEATLWLSKIFDGLLLHVNDSLLLDLEEVAQQHPRIIITGLLSIKSNPTPHRWEYLEHVS